jgi:predicted PurR-regulated permease PerM
MIDILMVAVTVLSVLVGLLFFVISELKREITEVTNTQHVQDEDIYKLMKSNYNVQSTLSQHNEVITYLADQDPLIGKKKIKYPTIVGEA